MGQEIDLYLLVKALMVFGTSFIFTFVVIPFVIRIVRKDEGNSLLTVKSPDYIKLPALGGITLVLGILIAISFWVPFGAIPKLQYYFSSIFVIMVLGIKDDFEPLKPLFKLVIQFCSAAVLVFLADLYYQIDFITVESNIILSKVISLVSIVFLMNTINFLDGINGLCASITVLAALCFGTYFFIINQYPLSSISFALAGSSFAFLYYNITPARIFMGDTGSLTIGIIIAILSINFLNMDVTGSNFPILKSPSFLFAILIIPIVDAIRVIVGRLFRMNSPFLKDKTHIHHILLSKGMSHMQATAMLILTNILFIIAAYYLQNINTVYLIISLTAVALILVAFVHFYKGINTQNNNLQNSY